MTRRGRRQLGAGGRVHRRDHAPLRPRRPLGLPGAARRRPLLRDERAAARTPLRLGRPADQPARRHRSRCPSWPPPAGSSTSRPTRSSCSSSCTTGVQETLDFLEPHCAFFTFAENWGKPGLRAAASATASRFLPTRQPVVLDLWPDRSPQPADRLHDDRQLAPGLARRHLRGRALHLEQAPRVPQVPRPAASAPAQAFELALSSCEQLGTRDAAAARLAGPRRARGLARDRSLPRLHRRLARRVHGRQGPERAPAHRLVQRPQRHLPRLRPPGDHPGHRLRQRPADAARACSPSTRSDEAAGGGRGDRRRLRAPRPRRARDRPRVLQPRGGAAAAARRPRRALGAARGARRRVHRSSRPRSPLEPVSRRPTVLPRATVEAAQRQPTVAPSRGRRRCGAGSASIVVVTYDNLPFTRLCLESVLANTEARSSSS